MRKTITLILALTLTLSLCACGSAKPSQNADSSEGSADLPGFIEEIDPETADTEQVKANYDKAVAYIESVADLSGAEAMTDDSDPSSLQCHWDFEKNSEVPLLSRELELDGNKIVIGETTIKDIDSFGLEASKFADVSEPNDNISVSYEKNRKYFSLQTLNDTNESIPLDDMPVCGFDAGVEEYTIPYNYMGITVDMDMEAVLKTLDLSASSIAVVTDFVSTIISLYYEGDIAKDGNRVTSNRLELNFAYDPESNATEISSVSMLVYSYDLEE